jgi:CheY-like chemotaxis protein
MYKFLIIDDSEVDQLITSMLLRKHGITDVYVESSAEEGLAWLEANKAIYTNGLVILLDIKMPEKDGFDFLQAFQLLDNGIQLATRVFMLSSTIDPRDLERALSYNPVKNILNKPLHAADFLKQVGLS